MGRRSWIIFVYSKETAEKVKLFCEKIEDFIVFIVHGSESDKTPALLTQSDGESIVREIVDQGIISWDDIIYLGDISIKQLENTGDGYKLKNATYLSEKEFFDYIENKSFPRRNIIK